MFDKIDYDKCNKSYLLELIYLQEKNEKLMEELILFLKKHLREAVQQGYNPLHKSSIGNLINDLKMGKLYI